MSVGEDLVTVATDAREVYRAAKQIGKDLEDEDEIAQKDAKAFLDYAERLRAIVKDLPSDMSKAERRQFVSATKATIQERLKHQDAALDFEERLRLNAQLFTLENQELKVDLLDRFDVRHLVDAEALEKLRLDLEDARKQIRKRLKARGYVRVAIRLAILAVDLGVLIAKGASGSPV